MASKETHRTDREERDEMSYWTTKYPTLDRAEITARRRELKAALRIVRCGKGHGGNNSLGPAEDDGPWYECNGCRALYHEQDIRMVAAHPGGENGCGGLYTLEARAG